MKWDSFIIYKGPEWDLTWRTGPGGAPGFAIENRSGTSMRSGLKARAWKLSKACGLYWKLIQAQFLVLMGKLAGSKKSWSADESSLGSFKGFQVPELTQRANSNSQEGLKLKTLFYAPLTTGRGLLCWLHKYDKFVIAKFLTCNLMTKSYFPHHKEVGLLDGLFGTGLLKIYNFSLLRSLLHPMPGLQECQWPGKERIPLWSPCLLLPLHSHLHPQGLRQRALWHWGEVLSFGCSVDPLGLIELLLTKLYCTKYVLKCP